MKVGDLVQYLSPGSPHPRTVPGQFETMTGTVIEFPQASHPKEFQKVRVLTSNGITDWIMQFCEVISESR